MVGAKNLKSKIVSKTLDSLYNIVLILLRQQLLLGGKKMTEETKTKIEYLREIHQLGQSLIDFAKDQARELSDEICEIAGPEIAKRHRG